MEIEIKGARENNLKNIDVKFKDGLTVVTGISGSGKSSLVFDTLYHESNRRLIELFGYSRKWSSQRSSYKLAPAKVGSITGLGPAVAVGQNLLNRNPNSTLATASGLHPLFRLLYARFGVRTCHKCGTNITVLTQDEIINYLFSLAREKSVVIYSQLVNNSIGSHKTLLNFLSEQFSTENIYIDDKKWEGLALNPSKPHKILIKLAQIDKSTADENVQEIVQRSQILGSNILQIEVGKKIEKITRVKSCVECGTWLKDIEPKHFYMSCPFCKRKGCKECNFTGLHPLASSVYFSGQIITQLLKYSVKDALKLFKDTRLSIPTNRLITEITKRLVALKDVGLDYLTLNRSSPTLSRGESQRVRIALTLINQLEDVLHVLDEPTIGQHVTDITKFLPIFHKLPGPVIFVEHDRIAASAANNAIDIGPGAGTSGGSIIFNGSPSELWESNTPTGEFFSLRKKVIVPKLRPKPNLFLKIEAADKHNLKEITVEIPLNRLTVITGVSGSGKSTLIEDVLHASLHKKKPIGCGKINGPSLKSVMVDQSPIGKNPRSNPATYTKISEIIRKLFSKETGLSASHYSFNRPEGACPTCKGMGALEIRMRYIPSSWISCPDCKQARFKEKVLKNKVVFGDKSYSISEFYNLSVSEIADLIENENRLSSNDLQKLKEMLKTLKEIGLGYLSLGQPSPSLSGGEAQRIKLSKYLGKTSLINQIIILDEPSTGLHPQDLKGLLVILDRLVRARATVIIVEHNLDVIKAADWVIDLGPGAGDEGGNIIYSGPIEGLLKCKDSKTAKALKLDELITPSSKRGKKKLLDKITIKNAHIHNLKGIDVEFPKNAINVVTGVSGSGKSSLVSDVIEAEAKRRFFETLSMYERQGIRGGPEVLVDEISGLGVTSHVISTRALHSRFFMIRNTIGKATEISLHIANLLAYVGEINCPKCGVLMIHKTKMVCDKCNTIIKLPNPIHFDPASYQAACRNCHGIGTVNVPQPDKLIINPEKPLCKGAMHSPGFFPQGYLCKPYNGGYYVVQALAKRYDFDPASTPWNEMTKEAQDAFLFGNDEPLEIHYENRKGDKRTYQSKFNGFYHGWVDEWDIGGTYTDIKPCESCKGAKLRPEYLAVTLNGYNMHQLSELPLVVLLKVLKSISIKHEIPDIVHRSYKTVLERLNFLIKTGLGYVHLNRIAASLSAGEAQRIRLAGVLGSGLTSLTIVLDEPSRGLHPSELEALLEALVELRDMGNTILMVEHDMLLINSADFIVDMGPKAGIEGGEIVATGPPIEIKKKNTITANWLDGRKKFKYNEQKRTPKKWLKIYGVKENNLKGETIEIPHGLLVGLCGVSGSGKSTLLIDTIGRALAPKKHTTSMAHEPIEPGKHDKIEGELSQTIIIDQTRASITSPMNYLGLKKNFFKIFAESEDAISLGLSEKDLKKRCTACKGYGLNKTDMGFLPDIYDLCEVCNGTGYSMDAWKVKVNGISLPELNELTIDEIHRLFKEEDSIEKKLKFVKDVGLGYLVMNQPAYTLSGGEVQRLKIAKELSKKSTNKTMYILDEPTVGQHMEDVSRLINVLQRLVKKGHTVVVIEHHPHLLAACDWLIELGPGAGDEGGRLIAAGTPVMIAEGITPTAPYIKEVLEEIA
ncbi:MAG: ATP-binding cassette domain-containing protein [Candidatus Lokiarchaeota archaeon]|nr:ATP-binding cassette domain-containing protein [Candidatus Lokiarchaeota archaeon]